MKKTVFSLGLLILISSFVPHSKAPTIIDHEFEFAQEYTLTNPCNGEEVTVSGMFKGSMKGIIMNNRVNAVFHMTTHATGAGSMGNAYLVNFNFVAPFTGSLVNGQMRRSFSARDLYISSGKAPNFSYLISYQTTVNAKGNTTMERFGGNIFEAVCLGNSGTP